MSNEGLAAAQLKMADAGVAQNAIDHLNRADPDRRHLIQLGSGEGTFTRNAVLDALRQAAAHVPGFSVEARLLAST